MDKIRTKVLKVNIGNFDVDSIVVNLNNVPTEICFPKSRNVSELDGKEVYISLEKGIYVIEEIKKHNK